MTILAGRDNSQMKKEFLIPKDDTGRNEDWVHIQIDYFKNEFRAKKIRGIFNENEQWIKFDDSTFPSSLLREFINSDCKI